MLIHLPNIINEIIDRNKVKGLSELELRRHVVKSILDTGYIEAGGVKYYIRGVDAPLGGTMIYLICPKCDRSCRVLPCHKCFPRDFNKMTILDKTIQRALAKPTDETKQDEANKLLNSLSRRIKK